jgi:molecular chaperone DnaK
MFAVPLTDARGMPIELTINISRDDYEPLITGMVERSAEIVKRLLEHERLAPSDVSRMLLIGGPTYSPLVRRMLPVLTGILSRRRSTP